jgi:hypothetical protein
MIIPGDSSSIIGQDHTTYRNRSKSCKKQIGLTSEGDLRKINVFLLTKHFLPSVKMTYLKHL